MRHLFFVFLFLAPIATIISLADKSFNNTASLFDLLKHEEVIDDSLSKLLKRIAVDLEIDMKLDRKLVVNSPPTREAYSLVVLDLNKAEEKSSLQSVGLNLRPEFLRLNAIAISPDIILIDANLLRLHLMNQIIDLSLMARKFDVMQNLDRTKKIDALELARTSMLFFSSADQMRFRDIRSLLLANNNSQQVIAVNLFASEIELPTDQFYFGLFPILGHELGHLTGTADRVLPSSIDPRDWVAQWFISVEEEADISMLDGLERALERRLEIEPDKLHTSAAIMASVRLLRDHTFFKVLEDFRGFTPEHYLTHLEYRDCRKEESRYPIHDVGAWNELAEYSRFPRLPLFSEYEFQRIRDVLGYTKGPLTHVPNDIRAGRMLSSYERIYELPTEVQWNHMALGAAAYLNNPKILYPRLKGHSTGISVKALIDSVAEEVDFLPAVSCHKDVCDIGYIKSGTGHLELVKLYGEVVHLRSIANPALFQETGVHDFAVLYKLISHLLGEDEAITALAEFFERLSECGASTMERKLERYSLLLTSLPDQGSVVMDVIPNEWILDVDGYEVIQWPWGEPETRSDDR